MPGTKEIVNRIKSVKNTKKITYAMKLVSATKLRRAQEAVESARHYNRALSELLARLAFNDIEISHRFLEKRPENKVALVVIGGSRGLCGAYNSNINKAVEKFYREHANQQIDAYLLGRKPTEYFKKRSRSFKKSFEQLNDDPNKWPILEIMEQIEDGFAASAYDSVYFIYTRFKSAISVYAETHQLLPVNPQSLLEEIQDIDKRQQSAVLFEPSAHEVFEALIPRIVRGRFRQACLESKASEQGSRMTAMDAATKNASELIDSLTLTYNKLRQSGITSQLLDIMGGAEGLK